MCDKIDGAIAIAIAITRFQYFPFPSPFCPYAKLEFCKISFVNKPHFYYPIVLKFYKEQRSITLCPLGVLCLGVECQNVFL